MLKFHYELQVTYRVFSDKIHVCYMGPEPPHHETLILVAEYNPEPVEFTVTILVHVRMRHSIEIVNPVPNAPFPEPRYHRRILQPLRSFKIWAKSFGTTPDNALKHCGQLVTESAVP